ncbi:LOW QUALITY PROTEIN: hypothetical protein MAR_035034 [Mya arenaria]|uniref:Uncharacterized protein n=1 Tax=Mya arenaria TaxID=6604 RepID=A0ABY7EIY6_MYAAR|nr:LOW QUALITY PROTEIN: hypothetical protein MAR_035034 [Mya arenaria]
MRINFQEKKINFVVYKYHAFTKEEIERRAKELCHIMNDVIPYNYDFFPIIHFASLCVIGKALSLQIGKVATVVGAFLTKGFSEGNKQ